MRRASHGSEQAHTARLVPQCQSDDVSLGEAVKRQRVASGPFEAHDNVPAELALKAAAHAEERDALLDEAGVRPVRAGDRGVFRERDGRAGQVGPGRGEGVGTMQGATCQESSLSSLSFFSSSNSSMSRARRRSQCSSNAWRTPACFAPRPLVRFAPAPLPDSSASPLVAGWLRAAAGLRVGDLVAEATACKPHTEQQAIITNSAHRMTHAHAEKEFSPRSKLNSGTVFCNALSRPFKDKQSVDGPQLAADLARTCHMLLFSFEASSPSCASRSYKPAGLRLPPLSTCVRRPSRFTPVRGRAGRPLSPSPPLRSAALTLQPK